MIIARISPFRAIIGYPIGVTRTNLVRCATITRIPYTPSIIIVRNNFINLPWICMPLFFNILVFGNVLWLDLNTYFVFIKVVILAWLNIGWSIVIFTFSQHKMTWFGELGYFTIWRSPSYITFISGVIM